MTPKNRTLLVLALTALLLPLATAPHAAARPPRYAWPLAPPHPVLRAFQGPSTPFGAGHRGVDLGSTPDTPVLAAADATVVFAGTVGPRQLVSLAHQGGLRTTYEPVKPLVTRGQRVARGAPIGALQPGHEGCRTTCLHWGALRTTPHGGREYLDPLTLLATAHVRLLPLVHPTPSPAYTPPPRAGT
ncbi:murein hydrolase activator EnvC family protein [Actinosynnema sp. CS-041913]|uniref:murein hydrolase activator EnvC family protein n=1 Tax=Actinosynnema sp. CS-041913 TaxID=3239917 RepID=UPI003D8EB5E5